MKSSLKNMVLGFTVFVLFGIFMLVPKPSRALNPLDDQSLIKLSPSTMADEESLKKPWVAAQHTVSIQPAVLAACFLKCHKKTDFVASDKTKKQWRMLIKNNGHDIFTEIHWKNQAEKDRVVNFLIKHAKDSRAGSEGIGAW